MWHQLSDTKAAKAHLPCLLKHCTSAVQVILRLLLSHLPCLLELLIFSQQLLCTAEFAWILRRTDVVHPVSWVVLALD
jgi:hypothetical protein